MKTKSAAKAGKIQTVGVSEVKTHLSKFLRQARAGTRIIITQRGQPIAELRPTDTSRLRKNSHWGDMKGKIWISDDFCDELEELKEYFT